VSDWGFCSFFFLSLHPFDTGIYYLSMRAGGMLSLLAHFPCSFLGDKWLSKYLFYDVISSPLFLICFPRRAPAALHTVGRGCERGLVFF
jgi:hypothetical protein